MKFDSKSVLLNDGVTINVKINLPNVFDNVIIPPGVWNYSIKKFNQVLNERKSVTTIIGNLPVDILCLGDKNTLSVAVHREDIQEIASLWFSIKGQIVFKEGSSDTLEEINIDSLFYRDQDGVEHFVVNKT